MQEAYEQGYQDGKLETYEEITALKAEVERLKAGITDIIQTKHATDGAMRQELHKLLTPPKEG